MAGEATTRGRRVAGRAWRAADSYGLVLFLLVVTYVTLAFASPGAGQRFALVVLQGVTSLFALHTSRVPRRVMRAASVAFLAAFAGLIVATLFGSLTRAGLPEAASGALLFVAPPAILWRILQHRRVTGQTVMGAIAVYGLIGLLMAFVFASVSGLTGQPFFKGVGQSDYPQYLFFSFVTLTTTGYGDLVPATTLGQTLAVFEAMAGQVFLVTLVARLVSLLGKETPQRAPRRREEE